MSDPKHEEFVRCFAKHEADIRRYAMTLLFDPGMIDDILQETSIALWRKFDQYDKSQPFVNWACRFAYYEVMNQRKKRRVRDKNFARNFSQETFDCLADERLSQNEKLETQRQALRDCLKKLPEDDRELLGMRYTNTATIAEIAEDLGEKAKHLYRQLERIRRNLAKCSHQAVKAEDF